MQACTIKYCAKRFPISFNMYYHFIWLLMLAIACEPARSDFHPETIDDQIVARLKQSADSILPLASDPGSLATTPFWVKGECLYFGKEQKTTRLWYDEQGRITGLVEYRGEKLLDSVQFFSNGQRIFSLPLDTLTGQLNGPARYYHPDGRVRQDGRFEKGIKTGIWREFDENGKLQTTHEFKADGTQKR